MLSRLGALEVTCHCCGPWPSRAKVGGLARMCESALTSDLRRVDSVSGIHWGQFSTPQTGMAALEPGRGISQWSGAALGWGLAGTQAYDCFLDLLPGPLCNAVCRFSEVTKDWPPSTFLYSPPNPPCQALPCLWPGPPGPGPLPLNVSSLHTLFSALSMVPLTLRLI